MVDNFIWERLVYLSPYIWRLIAFLPILGITLELIRTVKGIPTVNIVIFVIATGLVFGIFTPFYYNHTGLTLDVKDRKNQLHKRIREITSLLKDENECMKSIMMLPIAIDDYKSIALAFSVIPKYYKHPYYGKLNVDRINRENMYFSTLQASGARKRKVFTFPLKISLYPLIILSLSYTLVIFRSEVPDRLPSLAILLNIVNFQRVFEVS